MNVRWVRSNEIELFLLAIAIVAVGSLTAAVVHQQHDQSSVHGQVYLETDPAADPPTRERAPDPATVPAMPAPQEAPVFPAPHLNPAPQIAPIRHKSHQPNTRSQRRAHPVLAPRQPAPVQPATPVPVIDPAAQPATPASTPNPDRTPRKASTPPQSGMPTGSSGTGNASGTGDAATQETFTPAATPAKKSAPNPAVEPASPGPAK